MDSSLVEILIQRLPPTVSEAISSYEKKFGRIKVSAEKEVLNNFLLQIYLAILKRIEDKETVTIEPLRLVILEGFFKLGIDSKYSPEIFDFVKESIFSYIDTLSFSYAEIIRDINDYTFLLKQAFEDINSFSSSSIVDILQTPEEYQYSEKKFYFQSRSVEKTTRKAYTLFPKERYWEVYRKLSTNQLYSPLSYNRTAGKIGKPEFALPIEYDELIIYEDELYKLNSDIKSPIKDKFDESEWTKYVSKRLNPSARFKQVFDKNVETYYTSFLENGFDINQITSDSKVIEYSESVKIDEDLLVSTFGGEGKVLLSSIKRLKRISDLFGSFQGSIAGGIEYVTKYTEYLLGSAYGRNQTNAFETINNQSAFGRFDLLFASKTLDNRISGLKFLEGFIKLNSFIHNQIVPDSVDISNSTFTYNPIHAKFRNGVTDTYKTRIKQNSYSVPPTIDLIASGLNTLYTRCIFAGDLVQATLNALDSNGRLRGYEGLGSIEVQLKELQRVFPPSSYLNDLDYAPAAGLSGGIKYILESYTRLYKMFVYTKLPGKYLEFILEVSSTVNEQVKNIIETIKRLSIESFKFVPNISTKYVKPESTSLVSFLTSLGFKDSEINILLNAGTFNELITSFAPISDSSDIKSFFKGYELSQLIYEIAGDEGIDAYLSFLYSTSDIDGLLNILSIAQKDKSKATYAQINKYPKLIGLLIGLTYAIDPNQLVKFIKILGKNNLTLLESITYLLQSGQRNIIKSKEEVSLLQPIINQAIQGTYEDPFAAQDLRYDQINKVSPIALKQWTEVINENLGNISSVSIIENLYDRSVGLTPKEILEILNIGQSNTTLGQVLDGFNGGNFTKFIQYANITGLGIKLGSYKNSSQLNNFELQLLSPSVGILPLLEELERISSVTDLINVVFESNLDFTLSSKNDEKINSIVYSQNKTFESLIDTYLGVGSQEDNLPDIVTIAANSTIIEPPGVGNSRLPNRIPVSNSITPEQYRTLFPTSNASLLVSQLLQTSEPSNLINKFIKFSESNKLINLISQTNETESLPRSNNTQYNWQPKTAYESTPKNITINPIEYSVPGVYYEKEGVSQPTSGVLGVSYFPEAQSEVDASLPSTFIKYFDPIESCKRFGGQNCEDIYADVNDRCVDALNKSLYPEEYIEIPGSVPNRVAIDRPLGSFAEFKPSEALVPTSSYTTPPSYVSLLGINFEGFGNKGEPIMSSISSTPITFSSGGGELSEFNNTEFAIIESIKAKLEKDSEFSCASFQSPFEYQMCMNIVKCKKFSVQLEGEYYLDFCPKTLSGGLAK